MNWQDAFFQDTKPTFEQINEFINNPLWDKLNKTLVSTYNVEPKLEYSKCSMQRGWNVKYKKRGNHYVLYIHKKVILKLWLL